MERETGRTDVQGLLQAIRVTKVLETRIQLFAQLEDSDISDNCDSAYIAECLAAFWEESASTGVSQCKFNGTILRVAARYLELGDIADSRCQFLVLATKASIWCGKHLQMTDEPMQEFQEEHSNFLFQLVLDTLSFSSATFSALTRFPISTEKVFMLTVENFISEQLKLIKTSISEIKRIHLVASEVLKVAQKVIDSAIKLCKSYSQAITESITDEGGGSMERERAVNLMHVINIASCTIENLYELGILAATGGGSLVMILNISWKGVVTLLQLDKLVLTDKINIQDIILTLISLANESLRCGVQAWSSAFKGGIAATEAKRSFLPIKFYLINAARISTRYPYQASRVYKDITQCVLKISAMRVEFSKEAHFRAASEALAEFLEPTSFLLIHSLLNSAEVEHQAKLQILDWLFPDKSHLGFNHSEENAGLVLNHDTSMDDILMMICEAISGARILTLGRVLVFINLLKSSPDLREEVVLGISRKLGCLLDFLIDDRVYGSILGLHIPVLCGLETVPELVWQSVFPSLLHALKTFMIVAASTNLAWLEVEAVLLSNCLHPHFLCQEIVTELWCFLVRHGEGELVNYLIDNLCSLIKTMSSLDRALSVRSSVRNMARLICTLLSYANQITIDKVYNIFVCDDKCHSSSIVFIALLVEGFPLSSLSDTLKKSATQQILTSFYEFMEIIIKKHGVDSSSRFHSSGLLDVPVFAFSSALHNLQINSSDIDNKRISQILKFTVAVIHGYVNSTASMKGRFSKLLSQALDIISNMKHIYSCDGMEEVIFELQTLMKAGNSLSEKWFNHLKPSLAFFLAGLSHMEVEEGEEKLISLAAWEMYHVILRERHWAFVHLALVAFSYFAARTSCQQLWRFVPQDAALSFDTETGKLASEEAFMSELKVFLGKEVALRVDSPCKEQLGFLANEGSILKDMVAKELNAETEACGPEAIEVDCDDENCIKKKRKVPDGITEGMSLLRRGLKVMNDGLAGWKQHKDDSEELQEEFTTHLSCLEDVITHMVGLVDR